MKSTHRRWTAVAFLIATMLAAGGCKTSSTQKQPPSVMSIPAPAYEFSLWVEPEAVARHASSPLGARDWLRSLRSRGVKEIYVPAKDSSGRVCFPSRHAISLASGDGLFARLSPAAGECGVRLVAVFPAALGPAAKSEELVAYNWNKESRSASLAPASAMNLPSRNLLLPAVQERELALIEELAQQPIDALCLSQVGFPSANTDFSAETRRLFEARIGRSIRNWPEDVLSFQVRTGSDEATPSPGELWPLWLMWRAGELRKFTFDAERAIRVHKTAEQLPVILMVPPWYPRHYRQGLNWASPDAQVDRAFPGAPPGYEQTGVGALPDEFVLETYVPIPGQNDAVESKLDWWSSVEGASRVAAAMLPPRVRTTNALSLFTFAGADGQLSPEERDRFAEAIDATTAAGNDVLIVDEKYLDQWKAWEDLKNAFAPESQMTVDPVDPVKRPKETTTPSPS